MNRVLRLFKTDDYFGAIFMAIGCLVQVATMVIMKQPLLAFVSGIAGIISVVQCSQRRMPFYFWGFLQIATFSIICYQEHLYGKLFENAFYVCTMIWGIFIWNKNKSEDLVNPRKLDLYLWLNIITKLVLGSVVSVVVLNRIGGSNPMLDGITTMTAIIAQLLMVFRYREQWIFWLVVDLLCFSLFLGQKNYCMAAQYAFWSVNCVYGFFKWSK